MDFASAFVRHLARLVWQMLHAGDAYDVQLASLQLLVNASRGGSVSLAVQDWRMVVNGHPFTDADDETQTLVAQLIGHSVAEITFDAGTPPVELLLAARLLAAEPAADPGAASVRVKLDAVGARAVHVRVDRGVSLPPAVITSIPDARPDANGVVADARAALARPGDAVIVPVAQMYASFESATVDESAPAGVFAGLDAAATANDASRELDALLKRVAESMASGRHDDVVDVLAGLVEREETSPDESIRRQIGVAVRRMSTPLVLRSATLLLPRHRDRYDAIMAVLARAEDAGAEALVEALVAAPSIGERRVYYDALLRLQTGMRALVYMLGDSRWYVVRNAAELLGEMRATEAGSALTPLLEHPDDRVRAAVAAALARIAAPRRSRTRRPTPADRAEATSMRSVDSIVRALEHESDTRVQMALVTALGQLGTTEAVERLVEIARTERRLLSRQRPVPLRVAAVHAIGQAGSPSAHTALRALLRDRERAVRGAASWVILGRRDAPRG